MCVRRMPDSQDLLLLTMITASLVRYAKLDGDQPVSRVAIEGGFGLTATLSDDEVEWV